MGFQRSLGGIHSSLILVTSSNDAMPLDPSGHVNERVGGANREWQGCGELKRKCSL